MTTQSTTKSATEMTIQELLDLLPKIRDFVNCVHNAIVNCYPSLRLLYVKNNDELTIDEISWIINDVKIVLVYIESCLSVQWLTAPEKFGKIVNEYVALSQAINSKIPEDIENLIKTFAESHVNLESKKEISVGQWCRDNVGLIFRKKRTHQELKEIMIDRCNRDVMGITDIDFAEETIEEFQRIRLKQIKESFGDLDGSGVWELHAKLTSFVICDNNIVDIDVFKAKVLSADCSIISIIVNKIEKLSGHTLGTMDSEYSNDILRFLYDKTIKIIEEQKENRAYYGK